MGGVKVYTFQSEGDMSIDTTAISGVLTPIYTRYSINGKIEKVYYKSSGTSNGSIFIGISGTTADVLTFTAVSGTTGELNKYPVINRTNTGGVALIGASGNVWSQPIVNDVLFLAGSGLAEVGSSASVVCKIYYSQP